MDSRRQAVSANARSPLGMAEPDRQARLLLRGVLDSLPETGLREKLRLAEAEQRPLLVKLGIDPTAPDIHLGHAVVLRKLRAFQDLGHTVVLIIGDHTALLGDPSGRSALRPLLSAAEIQANAATFQEQALKILDPDPARLMVRRNSEWLDMPSARFLELARTTTVAQLLERDDFAKRLADGRPLSLLEALYPLLQGYDSVAVRADIELGGTDQKFNLLLGRDIQRAYGLPEQTILTMPILVGTDGSRKMSKSLGNHIGITEAPEEMLGRLMSIPDEAMREYFELLLEGEPPLAASPRDAKRELARGIVTWLHGAEAAAAAQAAFDRVFVEGGEPEEIEEAVFVSDGAPVHLPALMAEVFSMSRSEARRLIAQGGVQLAGRRLGASDTDLPAEALDGAVLQVGRRRFRRLRRAA